jgi:hypothetical protein
MICSFVAGRQPIGRPADPIAVARKHLVGRDGISISSASHHVDRAMAGMLDAVDYDEACVDAPCLASMIFGLSAGSSIGRVSGL